MSVRTRIAPSPTGDPHVGTAYVALFNYCFARKHGGQFILRIEDTDQQRSTPESERAILRALRWAGLEWDEGPDVGGPYGPYRQSERCAVYAEHAQRLLDSGKAFRCFCTAERLAEVRAEQLTRGGKLGYDGHCLHLEPEESARRVAAGETHVVRMVVPRIGTCVVDDYLRGAIEIEWAQVDMQVLMKSDGLPTYHLANVVDDHLMGITHVLRGEEWISSAPKHLALYEAFGWEPPVLCHLPLLRNPDKSKLSKRKNPTSILFYERMGYLPEALLNYLGRMAFSMPGNAEKFSLAEMIEAFELDRISVGGPVFDAAKLSWLNGRWIREDLDDEGFAERVLRWALNRDYLAPIVPLARERVERLSDLGGLVDFFFQGLIPLTPEALAHSKLTPDEVRKLLAWTLWQLDAMPTWDEASLNATLRATAALTGHKLRDFLAPFFPALTGKTASTPLFGSMAALGRDISRARLRHALDTLGGMGKKVESRWEKEYRAALAAAAATVET